MKNSSLSQSIGSSQSTEDNSRAAGSEAVQPHSIVAVETTTQSVKGVNDPVLILGAQVRTTKGLVAAGSHVALMEGPSA